MITLIYLWCVRQGMGDKTNETENKGSSKKKNIRMSVIRGKEKKSSELESWKKIMLSFYFIGLFFLLMFLLLELWPQPVETGEENASIEGEIWDLRVLSLEITEEVRFILIVVIMGALGGCVYSVRAFSIHVGRESFEESWMCWYFMRPLTGSILALIFYFAFRAAFFSLSADTGDLNVFGISTLGGIVGIFSKETIDKLEELFKDLLPTEEGQETDQRS